MREICITGSNGLVGSRFVELYSDKYKLLTPDVEELDITDRQQVRNFLTKEMLDLVINFAAFTDVGVAESQRGDKSGTCWKVNVEGVNNLAQVAKSQNIFFIQISTDMVFSGSKDDPGPYTEEHKPEENLKKLTWYGFTKGEGERIIAKSLGNYAVVRIICPVRAKYSLKPDYIHKPLSLFDQGKLYPLFNNQQISITFIDEACMALEKIIDGNLQGIYHASSIDTTTPFELISYLIERARGVKGAVKSASLDEFLKTAANSVRYPKYGGLESNNTAQKLELKFSTCKEIIDNLIGQGMA